MSYKLKLGVALVAVAALASPTVAAAQDPSTRTDIVIIGATLSGDGAEVADTNATPAPDAPVVYEDDAAPNATSETASTEEGPASSEAE